MRVATVLARAIRRACADIEAGNLKLILGVLWRLILRYQLQYEEESAAAAGDESGGAKAMLLAWVNERLRALGLAEIKVLQAWLVL